MREILIAFCEDGLWDIRGGDAAVVRRLLNDVQFVDYLRDAQELVDAAFEETTNDENN